MPPWGVVSAADADKETLLAAQQRDKPRVIHTLSVSTGPSRDKDVSRGFIDGKERGPASPAKLEFLPDAPARPWRRIALISLLGIGVVGIGLAILLGAIGLLHDEPQLPLPATLLQTWPQYKQALSASLQNDVTPAIARAAAKEVPRGWKWNMYHDPDNSMALIQLLCDRFPSLIRYREYGQSQAFNRDHKVVQQYPLIGIEISSNETNSELKPEFQWVAGIHGDEGVGRELLLRLAHYLVTSHSSASGAAPPSPHTALVTWLVDNTRIFIIQDFNPWGSANGSPNNSFGLDLDLAFDPNAPFLLDTQPEPAKPEATEPHLVDAARGKCRPPNGPANVGPVCDWLLSHDDMIARTRLLGWQPAEVLAFLDRSRLGQGKHVLLGASLRSGALAASHGLDACSASLDVCPPDQLLSEHCLPETCFTAERSLATSIAVDYAKRHPRMQHSQGGVNRAGRSVPFQAGTVAASAWEPHIGSLRDWMYWNSSAIMLDLLVDEGRLQADPSLLDALFLENRESMISIMNQVHTHSFKGHLVDQNDRPLAGVLRRVFPAVPVGAPRRQVATSRQGSFILMMNQAFVHCWRIELLGHSTRFPVLALRIARDRTFGNLTITHTVRVNTSAEQIEVLKGTPDVTSEDLAKCQEVVNQN